MTDEGAGQVGTYAYDAWGNVTASSGAEGNEYKFTSRRWDSAVGLQYNRARFYDPQIGRFISPDPLTGGPDDPTISYFGGLYSAFHRFLKEYVDALQPDKLNRYAYCYNNPVNLIDPLGLSAEENQVGVVQAEAESEQQGEKNESRAGANQLKETMQRGEKAQDVKKQEGARLPLMISAVESAIEYLTTIPGYGGIGKELRERYEQGNIRVDYEAVDHETNALTGTITLLDVIPPGLESISQEETIHVASILRHEAVHLEEDIFAAAVDFIVTCFTGKDYTEYVAYQKQIQFLHDVRALENDEILRGYIDALVETYTEKCEEDSEVILP